jgi:dihydroorotate dehydrogenase
VVVDDVDEDAVLVGLELVAVVPAGFDAVPVPLEAGPVTLDTGRVIVVVTWRTVVDPQPATPAAPMAANRRNTGRNRIHRMVTGVGPVELNPMAYRPLFSLVLARVDPERVHVATARTLGALGRIPGFRRLLATLAGRPDPSLEVHALGFRFPSPLGVAAGLDKNLEWYAELGALGFGFVEVGTVTAEPQPGNPRPRIHRLPADRALVNSMGFPNSGAAAAARRLARRPRGDRTILAVNIGRTKTAADAAEDYRRSVRRLAAHADLLVLNVSSPNTPGLRELQAVELLRELVGAVRGELTALGVAVPLLVKISPDLDDGGIDALTREAVALRLDGLVCTNTTVSRGGLASDPELTGRPGGVSGAPLAARSLAVLRRVRAIAGAQLVLVSVGGIETPDDALARIRAGATLVQAYTGFVYGGPGWPRSINRGLAERLHSVGARSVGALIGTQPGD